MRDIIPIEKTIIDMLDHLSKREMEILRFRFIQNLTQEQVGHYYKITKERIRQIEDVALSKINRALHDILKK